MEEGVKELKDTAKLVKRVMEAEQKLIAKKIGSINKKDDDWWDMQHSGWAMGGREMFAQKLFNILNGLDEAKLATYIMDKIGFKRSIPINEDDIAPLLPEGLEPGQALPGEEEPMPADAEGVEAMLVRGAKPPAKTNVGAAATPKPLMRYAKNAMPFKGTLFAYIYEEMIGDEPFDPDFLDFYDTLFWYFKTEEDAKAFLKKYEFAHGSNSGMTKPGDRLLKGATYLTKPKTDHIVWIQLERGG